MMHSTDLSKIKLQRLINLILESQAIYLCSPGRKLFTNCYITLMFKYITGLSKLHLKHQAGESAKSLITGERQWSRSCFKNI